VKFPNFFANSRSHLFLLLTIILLGAVFRFYKLDWGSGYFFHPDENLIATSVWQLSFPSQMNPHLFTYGTVTIYPIYFTRLFISTIASLFSLEPNLHPLLIGRFYSALLSTLTILVVYLVVKQFLGKNWALISAFLVATTAGLIQQAHFATPETSITFFLLLSFLFLFKFSKNNSFSFLVLASVFFGLALGAKISSLVFLPVLATTLLITNWQKPRKLIVFFLISFLFTVTTFVLSSPYVFLDFATFKGSIVYEGKLAVGEIPVFYTRQFIDTVPVLFQLEKILPFALGPILLLFGLTGLVWIFISILKKPQKALLILILAFATVIVPNLFLFVKWTRYITSSLPFFAIFSAFFLSKIPKPAQTLTYVLTVFLVIFNLLWSLAFFSIYLKPDIRITASNWMESNISQNSIIAVEGANTVDLPLKGNYQRTSLNFYDIEEENVEHWANRTKIAETLEESDYFLVQSRRVFANHLRLPNQFPRTAKFYTALFTDKLGFEQIKEFHSYPELSFFGWKMEFPDEMAEETWSVFDHPVVRIFKKNISLNKEDYAKFLEK